VKSPWSYKKWNLETYIAFHALRTYTAVLCAKQGGEAVVSLRIIRTKAKSVVKSDALKAAFREYIRRYKGSVVSKKKHYIIVDCRKFFSIDSKALSYLVRHGEMKHLDKIDSGLKKIFDWLLRQ
jgi:trehalose-6-phosphatase